MVIKWNGAGASVGDGACNNAYDGNGQSVGHGDGSKERKNA